MHSQITYKMLGGGKKILLVIFIQLSSPRLTNKTIDSIEKEYTKLFNIE